MSLVSFGSVNMDLVARTPRLPQPGETILGTAFDTFPGGKGANQAVAAARLGASVSMLGRVGQDAFGQSLRDHLTQCGVRCDRLLSDPHVHSGVAMIAVDQAGENHIIVIPGANGQIDRSDVDGLGTMVAETSHLLLQLEIPLDAVVAAAQVAKAAQITVILDPAPAQAELPTDLYTCVDILTPNQTEAAQLVGFPVVDRESAIRAGQILHQRGIPTVILKLGGAGCIAITATGILDIPPFPVDVVDTVAAGDAFNGALAVALSEGRSLQESLVWASATGALAVTQAGAQSAMPTRSAVEALIHQHHCDR
jgi:ribokinase